MTVTVSVPTLDFALFKSKSQQHREAFGQALVRSFQDSGFVKLINHGLPEETTKKCMQGTRDFFALPLETRREMANDIGPHPQRGFSRAGEEQTSKLRKENLGTHASFDGLTDSREHFDAGPPDDGEYPNKWPKEKDLPGWRELMESCYLQFQDVCLGLMSAMEVGLSLAPGAIVERCKPAASELRLNHYPQVDLTRLADGKVKRAWPHTDFGIITLLFQDGIGGLELENRNRPGDFIPVTADTYMGQTVMVVNISDTFQRWANNVIKAGVHQVSVPRSMQGLDRGTLPERYSTIFFFKAHRNTSVGPLPQFVSEENPAAYEEMSALDFQKQRTKLLY